MIKSPDLATVTVTYRPDLTILRTQLAQLPPDALRIIVDNASPETLRSGLRALAAGVDADLIENATNLGLAAAMNAGIAHGLAAGCRRILFLDQDTEPGAESVAALCAAQDRLQAEGKGPACVGPALVDVATGLQHGFHRIRDWRWMRAMPAADADAFVECANLNGSGTLVPRIVLEQAGVLEADFFIDHVDTEWSFRVLAHGFALLGVPWVAFRHRMGERTWRFWWFGWRVWPYRSPLRHRYLFRNAVRLMRRGYVPRIWKYWAVAKLMLTVCVHGAFDRQRRAQLGAMLAGIRAGLAESRAGGGSDG